MRRAVVAENKTKASVGDPKAYVAAIVDDERRNDCTALIALMRKATGKPPVMWGAAIVGFGVHVYPLAGGKTGEICAVGFSSRKGDISLYGLSDAPGAAALLRKLGTHKAGKGCLYVRRLADVDVTVLAKLVSAAFEAKAK